MSDDYYGSRIEDYETCTVCNGAGSIEEPRPQWDDPYFAVVLKCTECNGSGYILRDDGVKQQRANGQGAQDG